MPIPRTYAVGGEAAIATYSYNDIAEGTGITIFLGFKSTIVTPALLLTTRTITSGEIESIMSSDSIYTFDLPAFNLPKIIKGSGLIRFSWSWGGSNGHKLNINVKVQKVSAATTTIEEIDIIEITGTGSAQIKNEVLPISFTQTHFKKGDILRLRIVANYPSSTLKIGVDPANRAGATLTPVTSYPTKLELYTPFRLDL